MGKWFGDEECQLSAV